MEINCASCHSATEVGDSPFRPAPPFRDIAHNYTQDELIDGLVEGLAVSHPAMPDWDITVEQADAIASYIMYLGQQTGSDAARGRAILREKCSRCHAIDPA